MKGQSKYQREREKEREAAKRQKQLPLLPILVMMFASGFAGLVYQVLWMKQLGLLFGNTAHATSITLAVFFGGIGLGSWWWGKRTSKSTNPLKLYAILEIGIVITALVYFGFLSIFHSIYPSMYKSFAGTSWLMVFKFVLSLILIFPPAFFMGGTIPAIGQAIIRHPSKFGRMASFIYGTNTLGAALGVSYAAFTLIPSYGFQKTYWIAISLSSSVAAISWWLSCRDEARVKTINLENEPDSNLSQNSNSELQTISERAILILCFFSGFAVLSLEVLWTRIFAQVHENSVYSFSIILTVVLICLALGAWLSSLLSQLKLPSLQITSALIVIGGTLLLLNPSLIMHITNDLQPVYKLESWDAYVSGIYSMGFRTMGITVLALGTVFPFLMKATERHAHEPGKALGRILAANTLGAIIGAIVCGFILLPSLGMWGSMQIITCGYLLLGMVLPFKFNKKDNTRTVIITRSAAMLCIILLFTILNPTKLISHGHNPQLKTVEVIETWEDSDCTVAAIRKSNGHIAIKINGAYSLGSTEVLHEQANQSRIPLMAFPHIKSICNIGFGTGMSAGASLAKEFPNVEKIISCELTSSVVTAAKKYIPPEMTGGVFTDPRSKILIEDGRHFLMASEEQFDMINADLFLPFRRGAGSLYSLDHYKTVATRLNQNGIFVQWLPLYQITETEFCIITRTMMEVFGQVTLWRNNFAPGSEKVALIGQLKSSPLPIPPSINRENMLQIANSKSLFEVSENLVPPTPSTILSYYIANLTEARKIFKNYPINTDDQPLIEYQTPYLFREIAANDKVIWMVGPKLTNLVDLIHLESPTTTDPMLNSHSPASRRLTIAGNALHRALVAKKMNRSQESREHWQRFQKQWRITAEGK